MSTEPLDEGWALEAPSIAFDEGMYLDDGAVNKNQKGLIFDIQFKAGFTGNFNQIIVSGSALK